MTDKKSSESRRKILKSIAAGSGAIVAGKSLPESWSRPVVDSVMLPAHAQTSDPSGPFSYHLSENASVGQMSPQSNSVFLASIIDNLLPLANAGVPDPEQITVDLCIDTGYEGNPLDWWRAALRVLALTSFGPYIAGDLVAMYTCGDGRVGGPALTMDARICCGGDNPATTMQVNTADGTEAGITVTRGGIFDPVFRTAPIGACPFGDPDDEACNCDA